MKDISTFRRGLEELKISLSDKQVNQFLKYYELIIQWNEVMNLTAITEFEEVIHKHFLDSLALIKSYDLTKELSIIDMGTGAGFPGIPLKIAFPNLKILLVDSLNKRIKFLNEVIENLQLDNIIAIHARAEEIGKKKEFRERYDLCVSRAVANLATLSEYSLPFVKVGGSFIPYKSGKISEEVEESRKAINTLGGKIERVDSFILTGTDMERSFVIIDKNKITPSTYPRTAGKPTKEPIK